MWTSWPRWGRRSSPSAAASRCFIPNSIEIIQRIRKRGMIAGMITNGYLLVAERIQRLNRAGLEWLQISIDNVTPDEVSKKSLKVLDKKLELLAEHADFHVNINSVVGGGVNNPQDALTIGKRALGLGFSSTIGIIHDGSGQLQPLNDEERADLQRDEVDGEEQLHPHQRLPGQHRARPPQSMALPRRRALSLHLRRRPGALLLAAARLSRHSSGEVHGRRHSPRISVGKNLRSQLHGFVRPPGIGFRLVARAAVSGASGGRIAGKRPDSD